MTCATEYTEPEKCCAGMRFRFLEDIGFADMFRSVTLRTFQRRMFSIEHETRASMLKRRLAKLVCLCADAQMLAMTAYTGLIADGGMKAALALNARGDFIVTGEAFRDANTCINLVTFCAVLIALQKCMGLGKITG